MNTHTHVCDTCVIQAPPRTTVEIKSVWLNTGNEPNHNHRK